TLPLHDALPIWLPRMTRLQPILGLMLIALIAYTLSNNRRAIRPRTVAWGFGLQFLFAVIVLKTSFAQRTCEVLGDKIRQLLGFASVGSSFVFGPIGDRPVWAGMMKRVAGPEHSRYSLVS